MTKALERQILIYQRNEITEHQIDGTGGRSGAEELQPPPDDHRKYGIGDQG
jgi:hypothetical protein